MIRFEDLRDRLIDSIDDVVLHYEREYDLNDGEIVSSERTEYLTEELAEELSNLLISKFHKAYERAEAKRREEKK